MRSVAFTVEKNPSSALAKKKRMKNRESKIQNRYTRSAFVAKRIHPNSPPSAKVDLADEPFISEAPTNRKTNARLLLLMRQNTSSSPHSRPSALSECPRAQVLPSPQRCQATLDVIFSMNNRLFSSIG